MKPPSIATALVVAVTPPADYESVVGDLHEEYVSRCLARDCSSADRWYWSQVIRSVPSLLGYSRTNNSVASTLLDTVVVFVTVPVMMIVYELLENAIHWFYHAAGIGEWPFYVAGWFDAAFFGAVISMLLRSRGTRAAFACSFVMLGVIAIPIVLGFSSRLSPAAWLLILGAVPAMVTGSGVFQVLRRRFYTPSS